MKSLVGKMFSRKGTGFWLVLSQNPDYGYCHLLGLDKDFNVETTASYQPHYVERKKTVCWINIEDIRFTNETQQANPVSGDRREKTSDLSAILYPTPSHDGGSDRSR